MPQAFAMAVRQAVTFQQASVMASFGVLKTAIITMSMATFYATVGVLVMAMSIVLTAQPSPLKM